VIYIGENVWIASKATILRNVTIGDNAIIAASSVVRNCIVESNSLYAGIPAKFKKKLNSSEKIK
jgi:maltose O-acetyltransferase